MNTYTIEIRHLDVTYDQNGLHDVINRVNFEVKASNGQREFSHYETIELPEPSEQGFVEFNNLTEQQVLEWVESRTDLNLIKERLDRMLEASMIPPSRGAKLPPWKSV